MMNEPVYGQQLLYQADPGYVHHVRAVRERLQEVGRHCMNRRVRIQTLTGHVHEGVIVNIDATHLYLSVSADESARQWPNPLQQAYAYNNVILPLVLYELLVITLMYT